MWFKGPIFVLYFSSCAAVFQTLDGQVWSIYDLKHSGNWQVVSKLSKLHPKDMEVPEGGVDDMTKLSYLHEPAVLHNLAARYEINEIYVRLLSTSVFNLLYVEPRWEKMINYCSYGRYHNTLTSWQTYTGNILIAINPFQNLSNLYDVNMMDRYKGASFGELSPHVFATADAAYRWAFLHPKLIVSLGDYYAGYYTRLHILIRQMINEGKSNSILVSGESGAGKTETTKMLMRYLAFLGGNKTAAEGRTVEQQVLEVSQMPNSSYMVSYIQQKFIYFLPTLFSKYLKCYVRSRTIKSAHWISLDLIGCKQSFYGFFLQLFKFDTTYCL